MLAEAGDIEVHIDGGKMKASELMQLAERNDRAARELTDCIGAVA